MKLQVERSRILGYLSIGQAARLLGISRQAVWGLVKRGTLDSVETPLGYLISKEIVQHYKEEKEDAE